MGDMLYAFVFGVLLTSIVLLSIVESPYTLRREAFERGHMVECLGKAGYHWDCEE